MSIEFHAELMGRMHLRRGSVRVGGRHMETPHFHPILNVITGPPTPPREPGAPGPVFANGGVWKWFKRLTLRDTRVPSEADYHPPMEGFLTQVLHFLDYHVSPDMLDRWLGTHGNPDGKPITTYLEEEMAAIEGKRYAREKVPFLFLDSGGYKLLSAQQIDLSRYGWASSPKDILNLQLAFGGDLLATLDYPVHQSAPDPDARERFQKSMDNAIEALRLVRERGLDDKLVYLAVHGRNRREMRDYTRAILRRVRSEGLQRQPFGIAMGSLVPLNASPRALLDTVRGAMEAFHGAEGLDTSRIPVHAFGVNSSLAPFLTFMGVDSYDGSSFVQASYNLTYYSPGGFTPMRFETLRELDCRCRGCTLMSRGEWVNAPPGVPNEGLEAVQHILSPQTQAYSTYYEWQDGYVDNERSPPKTNEQRADPELCPPGVPRSYFYSLIALHNADTNFRQALQLQEASKSEDRIEELIAEAASEVKLRKVLQSMCSIYPELSDYMWRVGVKRLGTRVTAKPVGSEMAPVRPAPLQLTLKGVLVDGTTSRSDAAPRVQVNAHLGPEDFNVLETGYKMRRSRVVLLLPCSKRKPYSASSTHRFVENSLRRAGIAWDGIERVTLSGNYGPVPHSMETVTNVLAYDYMLHATNENRIRLVAERTREFLYKFEDRYDVVIAYCTPKPYRKAMELALEGRRNAVLLPLPLRAHTVSEFRSASNVAQLVNEIRKYLPTE